MGATIFHNTIFSAIAVYELSDLEQFYCSLTAHSLTQINLVIIALGRDVFYSIDASAAKAGYTPYTYPHPLQTGGPIVQIRQRLDHRTNTVKYSSLQSKVICTDLIWLPLR